MKTFVFCGRIYIAFFWRLSSFQEELGVGVAGRARISQWPMITVDQAQKMVLDQVLKFCLCLQTVYLIVFDLKVLYLDFCNFFS